MQWYAGSSGLDIWVFPLSRQNGTFRVDSALKGLSSLRRIHDYEDLTATMTRMAFAPAQFRVKVVKGIRQPIKECGRESASSGQSRGGKCQPSGLNDFISIIVQPYLSSDAAGRGA